MGLSIHAELAFKVPNGNTKAEHSIAALQELRQTALKQPFEQVSEIVHLKGTGCNFYFADEKHKPFLSESVVEIQLDKTSAVELPPMEAMFFAVWPGEGCEPATFGLARYPDRLPVGDYLIEANHPGAWLWRFSCKTQYASNVSTDHFLKCHTSLCQLLSKALSLGFNVNVRDDGHYWESHNIQSLTQELAKWNKEAAIIARTLTDIFGADNIRAPIQDNIAYITSNAELFKD